MYSFFIYDVDIKADLLRAALLNMCGHCHYSCFFDGNGNADDPHSSYGMLAAVSRDPVAKSCTTPNTWRFGYITYDHKNSIEKLRSAHFDGLGFEEQFFFEPEFIFEWKDNTLNIGHLQDGPGKKEALALIEQYLGKEGNDTLVSSGITPVARISKANYIQAVTALQEHIRRGDIYEINFCMEFYANAVLDPVEIYKKLNSISGSPFSAFCRFSDKYLLSSSPERFLCKEKNVLTTQPIKGTAKRGKTSAEDEEIIARLRNDRKELSENVMIVDLVRNDLARIAKKGTVKVDELFGIYTFRQVHQMISTVSCEIEDGKNFEDIIHATFPMGSMTGAPKISAMKLIEEYESTRRGLYSGAIGYIKPDGDFDLSVVIRSILYNESRKYVSFMVGSAITASSDPEKEYEECLLKAKAMFLALK